MKQVRTEHHRMANYLAMAETAGPNPFAIDKTGAGGSHGPGLDSYDLSVDATAEVQGLAIAQKDNLTFGTGDLITIEFELAVAWTDTFPANVSAFIGIGTARDDDLTQMTGYAGFAIAGSANVSVVSKNAAGAVSVAAGPLENGPFRRYTIALSEATVTKSPPAQSTGTPSNIRFSREDAWDQNKFVGKGAQFTLEGINAVQLIAQVSKASSTDAIDLKVREIGPTWRN